MTGRLTTAVLVTTLGLAQHPGVTAPARPVVVAANTEVPRAFLQVARDGGAGGMVRATVTPGGDGFLFVFVVDADGQADVLFPRTPHTSSAVRAGQRIDLRAFAPGAGFYADEWGASARPLPVGDAGTARGIIVAVLSLQPFVPGGLTRDGDWDLGALEQLADRVAPLHVGTAVASDLTDGDSNASVTVERYLWLSRVPRAAQYGDRCDSAHPSPRPRPRVGEQVVLLGYGVCGDPWWGVVPRGGLSGPVAHRPGPREGDGDGDDHRGDGPRDGRPGLGHRGRDDGGGRTDGGRDRDQEGDRDGGRGRPGSPSRPVGPPFPPSSDTQDRTAPPRPVAPPPLGPVTHPDPRGPAPPPAARERPAGVPHLPSASPPPPPPRSESARPEPHVPPRAEPQNASKPPHPNATR
jgi:hypothetical protein